jgi:hypothetical protein
MRKLARITILIKMKSIRSFRGLNESSITFWKKIGPFNFPKCKDNVMLQIKTKISFWVQNKPRVIIGTQMRDFDVKTCEHKVLFQT